MKKKPRMPVGNVNQNFPKFPIFTTEIADVNPKNWGKFNNCKSYEKI